ncbi:MAG: hypothetical protein HYV94_14060 [Candidatus Rokubacteria bacterium]|nr:hypothetical protein [Candidatus Rokubacteria bacterium]
MRDPGLRHAAPPLAEVPADEIHSNAASLRDLERGGLVALAQADDLAARAWKAAMWAGVPSRAA